MAAAVTDAELAALTERRVAGEPLEYVLGWAEFRGLRLVVAPGVFVPRTRTGFLVEEALAVCPRPAVVVDLCCGNGAIGAAIAAAAPGVPTLHGVDVDPAAVACARQNLAAYAGVAHVGDLFDPLPSSLRGRVDLLVANTPYVPTDAIAMMPPEAREHEARAALDGGPDGLALLRRVAASAPPGWPPAVTCSSRSARRRSTPPSRRTPTRSRAPRRHLRGVRRHRARRPLPVPSGIVPTLRQVLGRKSVGTFGSIPAVG